MIQEIPARTLYGASRLRYGAVARFALVCSVFYLAATWLGWAVPDVHGRGIMVSERDFSSRSTSTAGGGILSSATTHDLPDGFVERSTAMLIRDRNIQIDYAVGLSVGTMQSLMEQWVKEDKPQRDLENGEDRAGQAQGGDDANDEERVRQRFVEMAPGFLLKRLKLKLDGAPLDLMLEQSQRSPRHHFDLQMRLSAKLPAQPGQWNLEWDDGNFADLDGAVRMACKATGRSLLIRSTVAPIIVRADRIELGKMVEDQRKKALRFQATVKWLGSAQGDK